MKKELENISNYFKNIGKYDKAAYISKVAERDEPSDEELDEVERWLEEEGIIPGGLTEEETLSGLEGEDLEAARRYLGGEGTEEIRDTLEELKRQQDLDVKRELEQQRIMNQLSGMFMAGKEHPGALPFQSIIPEASLIVDLIKLSNILDSRGLYSQADAIDRMVGKFAINGDWDKDLFDDPAFEEEGSLYGEMEEPSTEEIFGGEDTFESQCQDAIDLLKEISEGKHLHPDLSAKKFLDSLDEDYGTYEDVEPPSKLETNVVPLFSQE